MEAWVLLLNNFFTFLVATAEIVQKYNILSIVKEQILKNFILDMFRKEKALTTMQCMEMLGRYTNDELYWMTTRCK